MILTSHPLNTVHLLPGRTTPTLGTGRTSTVTEELPSILRPTPPSDCCANSFGRAYRSSIRCCRSDTRRHCLDSGTPLYQPMTISNTHADHHHHLDGYVVCPVKAYFLTEFHLLCRGVLSKALALLSLIFVVVECCVLTIG